MNCYSIRAEGSLIPNVSNDQVLVKLYHGKQGHKARRFASELLSGYTKCSIANYKEIQNLGIPVASIYNLETALEECVFIVEKVPYELDLNQDYQLEQVCDLFKKSFENKAPIDLSFNNLRVQENGSVTVVDFVEKSYDFNKTSKLRDFTIQFLKSWCWKASHFTVANQGSQAEARMAAQKLLIRLTQGLQKHGFDLSWNQAALDECFCELELNFLKV
jgi:hypothetical protein